MSNTKTKLWDRVCETDPNTTKKVNQRGGFTAIGAQYQVKCATEKFGPYGLGFGVRNETFKFVMEDRMVVYQAQTVSCNLVTFLQIAIVMIMSSRREARGSWSFLSKN